MSDTPEIAPTPKPSKRGKGNGKTHPQSPTEVVSSRVLAGVEAAMATAMAELTRPIDKAHHEEAVSAPEALHTDRAEPSNTEELPPPIGEPMTPPKLSRFRLSVSTALATEPETTTTILIVRPPRDFIRVHPDPDYSLITRVLETKREFYLIDPAIYPILKAKISDFEAQTRVVMLVPYRVRETGQLCMWPLKMESEFSVGDNSYNRSAFRCAQEGRHWWVRVTTDMKRDEFVFFPAEADYGMPTWPDKTIDELVEIAAKVDLIDNENHQIIRNMRGVA
jgi:hypothetical protein